MYNENEMTNFRHTGIAEDLIRYSTYNQRGWTQYFMDINAGCFYVDGNIETVVAVLDLAKVLGDTHDISCMLQLVAKETDLLSDNAQTVVFARSYHVDTKNNKYISLKNWLECHGVDTTPYYAALHID